MVCLKNLQSEDYDTLLVFECFSYRSCKGLWKCCVENHAFFRLRAPPPPNVPALALFGFGSRFHYTGKTEYQTREDASRSVSRTRRTFFRSQSKRVLINKQVTPQMDTRRQIQPVDHSEILRADPSSETNKENMHQNGGNAESLQNKYQINGNGHPNQQQQQHNNALETYGIVSLKESKIEAWSMMTKNGGNGHVRNGAVNLNLPLESANNRTLQKTAINKQQEQPRMAWAEQHLSDE